MIKADFVSDIELFHVEKCVKLWEVDDTKREKGHYAIQSQVVQDADEKKHQINNCL